MEPYSAEMDGGEELPLHDEVPIKNKNGSAKEKAKRAPMVRPGFAKEGQPIALLTNHFKVSVRNINDNLYHYSVNLKYEDNQPVEGQGIGRKVIEKMQQIYNAELGKKGLAFDGEKALFTIGPLPLNNNNFTVTLEGIPSNNPGEGEHNKRVRRFYQAKTIKVELSYAAKIPMQSIAMALEGLETENALAALRVFDIILRQHAAKQGCLLVRQSFFHNNEANYTDLGGGILGCRGFHSSFRPVQGGLSLNIDVSTTTIVRPGPIVDFLIANQNVKNPYQLDWEKARHILKNLRVKVRNMEYKIVGLSELPCYQQMFTLRNKGVCGGNAMEITVYEYFVKHRSIPLNYSAEFPCINVGKLKKPIYFPIELCNLVSLQRYTKALTIQQRSSLVEKSRQKPQERMWSLSNVLKFNKYDADPMFQICGISISNNFAQVEGRVLQPPKLKFGNGEVFLPKNGRWSFNKKLIGPIKVNCWAVVNFSARCDINDLIRNLIRCGEMKGISIEEPFIVYEENPSMRRAPPPVRVNDMFDKIKKVDLKFLLCLLPDRKNSEIYGPWKRKCLTEFGIVTQCMSHTRVNDTYLSNLLLKINAKLGGLNSLLQFENTSAFPIISKAVTLILGMDVSHGSPGRSDVPSIAAVVSSRQWPLISKYRASVRAQSPKLEMIDSLFKPSGNNDEGIIRELLLDFYASSGNLKPVQIIIFRDGIGESQFNQVINIELDQIVKACEFLDEQWSPRFTLIIAQKNHHTKFFLPGGSPNNVPPGTVIDKQVCHPKNYDFFMCPHAGIIGTSRPIHYHVLLDENDLKPDDLQGLVHSLSYVYQKSTSAISVVAPICYAHLAAAQVSHFLKFDGIPATYSSQGGATSSADPVPELPKFCQSVKNSMFFC